MPVNVNMADISHNHIHYEERLDLVKKLLADYLHLSTETIKQTKITPVAYDPDCPFKYNNFVYHLTLPPNTNTSLNIEITSTKQLPPGCVPIPKDNNNREFILRLNNPHAEGMHQEKNRTQNEVSLLSLASTALKHSPMSGIIPRVYGWGPGWIFQEFMTGKPLSEAFAGEMSPSEKRGIMKQMIQILKVFREEHVLPGSIRGWGGVTFDTEGRMASAAMPDVGAGPWDSLGESYKGRIRVKLDEADRNPFLNGWRENGVRERVERFVEEGLDGKLDGLERLGDRVIVHGDFTTDNFLYDPPTNRLTALLDFDFSTITHPAHEYLRSLHDVGGQIIGYKGSTTPEHFEAMALQKAQITGIFPSPLPTPLESKDRRHHVDWELAKVWEEEMRNAGMKRIAGIERLADVDELLGLLGPFQLCNRDYLRLNPDEEHRVHWRRKSERELVDMLEYLGY
ncbi:kinase-like domain-containing protein [Poronia punctata]|nr:kinase-like domain-containing protein [Poronia punctata]